MALGHSGTGRASGSSRALGASASYRGFGASGSNPALGLADAPVVADPATATTIAAGRRERLALATLGISAVMVLAAGLRGPTTLALLALAAIAASYFALSCLRPSWARVLDNSIGVALEVSAASAVIVVLALLESRATAAVGAGYGAYFIVIALATLRSDPRLPALAGALAAAQYGLAYPILLRPDGGALGGLVLERCLWLVVGGAIASLARRSMDELVERSRGDRRGRQRAESTLGRYVSRDVAEELLRAGDSPGPQRRTITVLFCDLRGFTFLCERERPEDVVELLNTFYEQACNAIEACGGTVNKFLGDGLLALFGAPGEHPAHAEAAADASLALMGLVHKLRERGGVWTHLAIGIGLDTGDVVLGPIGSRSRAEYTAIGSPVNRAARLQALAERESRRIIVSTATRLALPDRYQVAALGPATLKGFAGSEMVFVLAPLTIEGLDATQHTWRAAGLDLPGRDGLVSTLPSGADTASGIESSADNALSTTGNAFSTTGNAFSTTGLIDPTATRRQAALAGDDPPTGVPEPTRELEVGPDATRVDLQAGFRLAAEVTGMFVRAPRGPEVRPTAAPTQLADDVDTLQNLAPLRPRSPRGG